MIPGQLPTRADAPLIRFDRVSKIYGKGETEVRALDDVSEHIRRGDIFQANLSQRWSVPGAIPGIELFAALARVSPASSRPTAQRC
mgnify:CR=1 FL=1